MKNHYSYPDALATLERINWCIENIIGADPRLDFAEPFMPESLAQVDGLSFLCSDEKRILKQIRGHEYLCMFGRVEETNGIVAIKAAAHKLCRVC